MPNLTNHQVGNCLSSYNNIEHNHQFIETESFNNVNLI